MKETDENKRILMKYKDKFDNVPVKLGLTAHNVSG